MRRALATALAAGALLVSATGGTAVAATSAPVDVKIDKKSNFEIQDPSYSQVGVSMKVKCDPSLSSLALDVYIDQQGVTGFGYVSGITCDGKSQSVTAHVQSNYGTVYLPGPATARAWDYVNNNTFTQQITIQ